MKSSDTAFLMPVYNAEPELLHAAVASVLEQTRAADLVIVDDGSDIPVSNLLEPDPKIEIIRLEQNAGVTEARNVGLHHIVRSGYDYIACIDSDDVTTPDRLEIQMHRMQQDPSLAIVGALAPTYDTNGNFLFTYGAQGNPDELARRVRFSQPFANPTVLFRTELLKDIGYYSKDFPSAEDYEFIFRAVAHGHKIDCVNTALTTCVLNPKGITLQNWRRQKLMRLKIQWLYFSPVEPASYLGMLSSIILLLLPKGAWLRLKKVLRPLPAQ